MAKVRFLYDNLIDASGVVVTESTENPSLPSTNVLNALKTKAWQTTAITNAEYIVFNLGSAQAATCVVIVGHNLTASDTLIKIEGNATDSWGSPSFSQTLTWNAGPIVAFFASQSYQYFRVSFTKSSAAETRDIGRIFIGPYYEAVQNVGPTGFTDSMADLSQSSESIGGQSFSDIRSTRHEPELNFSAMLQAQYEQFKTIALAVGTHTPFFVSIDHDAEPNDWMFYVKFKSLQTFALDSSAGGTMLWNASMQLSEQL